MSDEIKEYCKRVYGGCTDGSYEACLHYEGYYKLKNSNSFLAKTINEFEESDDASDSTRDL